MPTLRLALASLSLLFASAWPAQAATVPSALQGVGIHEHLGQAVNIGAMTFTDEEGRRVPLSSYFHPNRPVILNLVYYECPNLCNMLLNGLTESLRKLDWIAGQQFEIVTVSIDPREKPVLARKKKAAYLQEYGRPQAASGWHFLTGGPPEIERLSNEVGYGFRYDPLQKQFAHAAVLFVLTPEGRISRYLYGIEFPEKNLRLSLLEASSGKIGTVVDRVLLFCFHFDPKAGGYALSAFRVSQVFLSGVALALIFFLLNFWRKQGRVRLRDEQSKA